MALIDSLVSYYELEDNAANTTVVDVHGSNAGTADFNTEDRSVAGKVGNALDLERSTTDEINLGNDGSLNPNSMSVSVWIKTEVVSQSGNVLIMLGRWSPNAYSLELGTNNKPKMVIHTAGGQNIIEVTSTITVGAWTHIVFTWDSSTGGIIYVDGSNEASGNTYSGNISSSGSPTFIGALQVNANNFDGVLDEVGIWNRVLTSDEVTELYNSGNGLAYPFTVGTNMSINIADTFKDVDSLQINIGDVWKDVTEVQQNIGDVWKTVF